MDKRIITVKNVPQEVLEKAHAIANAEDRPLSQVIRELLRDYVKKNEQKLEKQEA